MFEGPEDYHHRIEDPDLGVEDQSVLIIRNCGPVGYPGSAEVVNMQPPAALLKRGIMALPTMGDGRQSGTSGSPSILNVSPEAAVGGGLALLQTGDRIRIDLNTRKVDVLLPPGELEARRRAWTPPELNNMTPWEEIYRSMVGQLGPPAPAWSRRRCISMSSRRAARAGTTTRRVRRRNDGELRAGRGLTLRQGFIDHDAPHGRHAGNTRYPLRARIGKLHGRRWKMPNSGTSSHLICTSTKPALARWSRISASLNTRISSVRPAPP